MIVRQRLLNATKHGGRAFDSKKLMMFLRALEKMPLRLLATSLMGWMTVAACTAAEPSTEWPYSRGDAAMTGLSPIEIRTPLTLAWQFETMKAKRSDGEMLVSTAVDGVPRIEVCASQRLEVSLSGASHADGYCHPAAVEKKVTGMSGLRLH